MVAGRFWAREERVCGGVEELHQRRMTAAIDGEAEYAAAIDCICGMRFSE